jgi:hypothetical protein
MASMKEMGWCKDQRNPADITEEEIRYSRHSSYFIQHCFICRPSDSTVPTDAGIEPRTAARVQCALTVRRSNHNRLDLIRILKRILLTFLSSGILKFVGIRLPIQTSLFNLVRHVTGNDKDYLRKIPRVVW